MALSERSKSLITLFNACIALSLFAQGVIAQPYRQDGDKSPLTVSVLDNETPLVNPLTLLLEIKINREWELAAPLSTEQFQIFVVPHRYDLLENEAGQYLATGAFVVYLHGSYFLDLRQLPVQLSKGDYDLLVRVIEDDRTLAEGRLQSAVSYTLEARDIAVLLDESADVRERGAASDELAKLLSDALLVFSDSRSATNRLCLISFGVKTRALLPLTKPSEKERFAKAIDMIGDAGPANIVEAVQLASKQLAASAAREKMLMLLSNQKDESRNYEESYAPLKEKGWLIHTIDPSAMLQTLEADKSLRRTLRRTFEEMCFRFRNEKTIWTQYVAAPLNGEKAFDVQMDSAIKSVRVACDAQAAAVPSVNQQGSLSREARGVQVALTDPQGALIANSTPAAETKEIDYPAPGKWQISIRNNPEQAIAEPLVIKVVADTSLFLRAIPLRRDYDPGEPIVIACSLADGAEPIANSKVEAQIIKPDGNSFSMVLAEAPPASASVPQRGVYVGTFTETNLPGDYRINLVAQGETAQGEKFERRSAIDAAVAKGNRFRFWTLTDLLDFGQMYNGEEKSQLLKVELMAKEGKLIRVEKTDLLRHDARTLSKDSLKVTPPVTEIVREDLDILDVALTVPEGQKAGTYMGNLKFASEYDERALPIRVSVRGPRIIIEPDELNLTVSLNEAGGQIESRFFARLSPTGVQTARVRFGGFGVRADEGIEPPAAIEISPAELKLTSEKSKIKVTLDIPSGAILGDYEGDITITTATADKRLPVTLSVRPSAVAVGGIDWLRLALVVALLLLILAILIAWLLSKRFQLQPHYMLKYFAASGLIHLILLILCLYVLIETKVVKVEDISPALAVKMKQLGGKFGIGLPQKIALATRAIPLAEKERKLELARREAEKLEENREKEKPTMTETVRIAAKNLEPSDLESTLTDAAKPIQKEFDNRLTPPETESIPIETGEVAEKLAPEMKRVIEAAEVSLNRRSQNFDPIAAPKPPLANETAISKGAKPLQFHPSKPAGEVNAAAQPLAVSLTHKAPDRIDDRLAEEQDSMKMEAPIKEKHLDRPESSEHAEAKQTRISKRAIDIEQTSQAKLIFRSTLSTEEFREYQPPDSRLIVNVSSVMKPNAVEPAADVVFPTIAIKRPSRENVMTDTLEQILEPERAAEKRAAAPPYAEQRPSETTVEKAAVAHSSELAGKGSAEAVAPEIETVAPIRTEPKAPVFPEGAETRIEDAPSIAARKLIPTPLGEVPVVEAPAVEEKRRVKRPPVKTEAAKRFAASLTPPARNYEADSRPRKERATPKSEMAPGAEKPAAVALPSIKSPVSAPIEQQYIGSRFPKESAQSAGVAVITLARYEGGDWNCNATALPNLAYQLEKRTASVIETRSQTIPLSDPRLVKAPFVFMTGHQDFRLTPQEIANLRAYLEGGGHLWSDDCTDEGDLTFDAAFRREIAKVLPGKRLQRLPQTFPAFYSCYDLTKGYKGYRIPPGDKYRLSYLEGIDLDGRIAVVYSRNDYGCGLEIDASTAPLMKSLTDLSPEDMQEGSIRMGINMALYFLGEWKGGTELKKDLVGEAAQTMRREGVLEQIAEKSYEGGLTTLFDDFEEYNQWHVEEGWGDPTTAKVRRIQDPYTKTTGRQLEINFSLAQKRKAAVVKYAQVDISDKDWCVMNVYSDLKGGARIALGLITGSDEQYFEARPVYIKPGFNEDVAFNLKAEAFKCKATGWRYTTKIADPELVRRIAILVYPTEPRGSARIDDIRFVTVE